MKAPSAFALEVVGGNDHGSRLDFDARVMTIGRARDCDLVLRDLAVSRRHLQAAVTENGVQFDVCGGASSFLMDGQPRKSVEAKPGERILIGNTILVVVAADSDSSQRRRVAFGHTDVRTVLTGAGADAMAMATIHALIEALDGAPDVGSLHAALCAWASEQTPPCGVEIETLPDAQAINVVVERAHESGTLISVPAPSNDAISLVFTSSLPPERVTDSFRRTLVVAGRLFGSSLARVRRIEVADGEVAALRVRSFGSAHDFLGSSDAAKQLAARIPKLAASDVSVLIEGETGVGKTFAARLIHEASPRAKEPLRVINCAAIPENLLESELFGHERGAFTGAVGTRTGELEAAGKGTLFLDEIGELSLPSQAKLLRAVEERKFQRVGSTRQLELRARLICATNRDLEQLVAAGQFRQDLLFRLAVVRLRVPPLRERVADIPRLAEQLLADATRSAGRRVRGFAPDAMDLICRYRWPGNVRELRNAIEHAIALGEGALIASSDLPPITPAATQPDDPDLVRLPLDIATLERRAVEAALRATGENRNRAAILLGMTRSTLYNKLKEYGLK